MGDTVVAVLEGVEVELALMLPFWLTLTELPCSRGCLSTSSSDIMGLSQLSVWSLYPTLFFPGWLRPHSVFLCKILKTWKDWALSQTILLDNQENDLQTRNWQNLPSDTQQSWFLWYSCFSQAVLSTAHALRMGRFTLRQTELVSYKLSHSAQFSRTHIKYYALLQLGMGSITDYGEITFWG